MAIWCHRAGQQFTPHVSWHSTHGSAILPSPSFHSVTPPASMTKGDGQEAKKGCSCGYPEQEAQLWQPGRQPVLSRAPNQAFRPRSSDKVQITAIQPWTTEPLRGVQRTGCCPLLWAGPGHPGASRSRAVPDRASPFPWHGGGSSTRQRADTNTEEGAMTQQGRTQTGQGVA